jgi:hypothetical protein
MKQSIFIITIILTALISSCSSIYKSTTKGIGPYNSIREIKNDIYCFDTSFGCEIQDAFVMLMDSIEKKDSLFINSKKIYFLYDSKDNSQYNFHSLISNDLKSYSIFSLETSSKDSNEINYQKDSIKFSEGVSKYWRSTIKSNWKITMDSIAGQWEAYDDAPWSIGVTIRNLKKKKYVITNVFGQ